MILQIKRMKQVLFILILISIKISLHAQSLSGTSGLLRIPTAFIQKDKTLIIGTSYLNKNLLTYSNYQYDAIAGFASITFLPFLEIGIRYTRKIDMPKIEYETREFADRMPSFKLRLLKEKKNRPALAIGSTDFITSIGEGSGPHYFASYYAVMTKNIFLKNLEIGLTLGHAFKLDNPRYYDMLGVFGGVRIGIPKHPWITAMIDYDSRYWNAGIRFLFFNHLQLMPVIRNGKIFEGNLSYRIYL
jgi:hypothetical protein